MESVKIDAYAKINLALAVTGTDGGYHMLDTLVCSVDIADTITLKPRNDGEINVVMRGLEIPPESNNAVKAARAYMHATGCAGADIEIIKRIPVGAGLGGSSADAAGVLRAMNAAYGYLDGNALKGLADGLGSDTGYMLTGGFARLTGRGDKVERISFVGRLHMLLLVPERGVSTAECYALYDSSPCGGPSSENAVKALKTGDIAGVTKNLCNALYPPAARLNGDIPRAVDELNALGADGVSMTGSGSGVFGIFLDGNALLKAKSNYEGKFACIETCTVQAY